MLALTDFFLDFVSLQPTPVHPFDTHTMLRWNEGKKKQALNDQGLL
jgi:hypothetical protein